MSSLILNVWMSICRLLVDLCTQNWLMLCNYLQWQTGNLRFSSEEITFNKFKSICCVQVAPPSGKPQSMNVLSLASFIQNTSYPINKNTNYTEHSCLVFIHTISYLYAMSIIYIYIYIVINIWQCCQSKKQIFQHNE